MRNVHFDSAGKRAFYGIWGMILLLLPTVLAAQSKSVLSGTVVDKLTSAPVALASVYWKANGRGCVTDSIGRFKIAGNASAADTLIVSFVGYSDKRFALTELEKAAELVVQMETASGCEVVVKTRSKRGLRWWQSVVDHKAANTPGHFDNYYSNLYTKSEIDISNISKEKLERNRLLRPLSVALNNADSLAGGRTFLPVCFNETISDYYVSGNPVKRREEVKAIQSSGIGNESLLPYMGGLNQKLNVYDDYIILFGKEFISPVSAIGDKYYNYTGRDTMLINGEPYFHLLFTPIHEGENLFSGDCWIHSRSWALKQMNLFISGAVNLNFVKQLRIAQEFEQLNKSTWIVSKENIVAELAPFGDDNVSLIGKRTTFYKNTAINQAFITSKLDQSRKKEDVIVAVDATVKGNAFFESARPEALSRNEVRALTVMDTLRTMPDFVKLRNTANFVFGGYKKYGMIEIGPWYKWMSNNSMEGMRLRFDLATTEAFSKALRLSGYVAYGTRDAVWKGKIGALWNIPGEGGWSIQSYYKHDLDNGRRGFADQQEGSLDNLFNQLIRRKGIKQKFIMEDEYKLSVTKTFDNSLSVGTDISRSSYETFDPLPPGKWFSMRNTEDNQVVNTAFQLRLRYAPGEKTIRTHRKVKKLKSNHTVTELNYTLATPGILGSRYSYSKVNAAFSHWFRIPRFGQVSYSAYAGKIFGDKIPFMLLEMHPGNEFYYYNKNSFNLMNRYEFFSDRYAGISIEHNFEKKLINLIPFLRKWDIRQFWNVKAVVGDVSRNNSTFNRFGYGNYRMKSLNGMPYAEIGTGVENIFKVLRVDFVWRMARKNVCGFQQQSGFGVFGSVNLQF